MNKVDETLQLKKPNKLILKGFKRRCFILKYSEIEENKNLISTLLEEEVYPKEFDKENQMYSTTLPKILWKNIRFL